MLGERVEGLVHVPVAQVPGGDAAAEHLPVVRLRIANAAGVLLGVEVTVGGDAAVTACVVGRAPLQTEQLRADRVLAGLAAAAVELVRAMRSVPDEDEACVRGELEQRLVITACGRAKSFRVAHRACSRSRLARASSSRTSSSVVWEKSSYQAPTARNGSG